jgi:heme exporter protein CcmD
MSAMGYIQGGWEFVWGAYGVTAGVLVLYALSIHARYRAERRRAEREAGPGGKP